MLRRVVSWLIVPALVGAQQASDSLRSCIPPHTSDSTVVTAYGRLTGFAPVDERRIPDWYEEAFIRAMSRQLRLPVPFVLSIYQFRDSTLTGGKEQAHPTAVATIALQVVGRTATAKLGASSAVPALDSALLQAVTAAPSDSAMPELPESLGKTRFDLRFRIVLYETPAIGIPMFRARVPLWPVSRSLTQTRSGISALRYPDDLRRANVEGSVRMQFVVDATGAPLQGTVVVMNATHELFARSVLSYLKRARYVPAMIGSCPIAVHAEQPFNFTLTR